MKVLVLKMAFHGGRRVRPGEVIEVADGAKAKWFAPTQAAETTKPGRKKRGEPETFSEVAQQDADSVAPEGGGADLV